MDHFFIAVGFLIIGFSILAFGAHLTVTNAATLAKKLGFSARLIGLTIIAMGTSIPELSIAIRSSIINTPGLSVGDVIGSNIVNIGLILGITTLFIPLELRSTTLQKEWPILFGSTIIVALFMLDGQLGHIDGILLLSCGIGMIIWMIQQGIKNGHWRKDILSIEYQKEIDVKPPLPVAILLLIFGFILLPIGSIIIVHYSIQLALFFQVRPIMIGLTVSALGTSLPELATSLTAAYRKEYDMVIGNILGSNTFNLLLVLSIPAFTRSVPLNIAMVRDYGIMTLLILLLFFFSFRQNSVKYVTRLHGLFFLSIYLIYLISIYFLH